MILMFEIYPPFCRKIKIERYGPLMRIIWGYFSVSYIAAGVNQMAQAFRQDEQYECAQICDDMAAMSSKYNDPARICAERIRKRGDPK